MRNLRLRHLCVFLAASTALPFLAGAGLAASTEPVEPGQPVEGLFINPRMGLQPPQGLLTDAWYQMELLHRPVGYMRLAMRRMGDRIETLDYTCIQIARGTATLKIVIKNVTVETLDGRPLEMHTEQFFASRPVRYDATFQPDGSIDLVITQNGNARTRRLPPDPSATFPWQTMRDLLAGQRKLGESFTERSYVFASDTRPLSVEHEAAGEASLQLPDGRKVRTFRYKVANAGLPGKGDVFCEPRLLIPLRFDVPVLSMQFSAMVAPKHVAMAPVATPAELFVSTMLRADVVGPVDPSRADRVLYTVQLPDDEPVHMPNTTMQRVLEQKGRALRLLVQRHRESQTDRSGESAVLEKYLAATTYCDTDDPSVRSLASEGAAGEKDPLRLAERLTRFVYARMVHKGLDVAFATASEAARTLTGDCTEHAVLLAALARANGLPARGVFGMVALPGSFRDGACTYGYHMWTQIHVHGQWMDFDAALNQPRPDATHIALGLDDLADTSLPMESVRTFMQVAGKTRLQAEPRG